MVFLICILLIIIDISYDILYNSWQIYNILYNRCYYKIELIIIANNIENKWNTFHVSNDCTQNSSRRRTILKISPLEYSHYTYFSRIFLSSSSYTETNKSTNIISCSPFILSHDVWSFCKTVICLDIHNRRAHFLLTRSFTIIS